MLSNTAAPKYYMEWRQKVIDGIIPVNREIEMEMNRIDDLIANPAVYYDDTAVEGWIKYCNTELTLTDGSDMDLLETFKVWGEQVYGWYYFLDQSVYVKDPTGKGGTWVTKRVKHRLINKQYLIVARGGAKSMYGSTIQSYHLNIDPETTAQVATAPTMRQADEVLSPIRTSITRSRGPLFKFLTAGNLRNTAGSSALRQKLASTKKGIENFLTGSLLEVRPMTKDKLQGGRWKIGTVDEWKSGELREDVSPAIEQSCAKNKDWLIVFMSSEGNVRNGPGDTIGLELMKILKGEYINPHVSIWWYKLDDIKEVADPSKWLKAQPNLGKTVSYETYHLEVQRAEQAPATRNDILAKRFGIPLEGKTYFFTYAETLPHRQAEYWGMECSLGADLSRGDDFCAFTYLFPLRDGSFGVKTRSYISQYTYDKLHLSIKEKYMDFIREGSLVVLDNPKDHVVLDMDAVFDDLDAFTRAHDYDVTSFGYDPFNAEHFVDRWSRENSPFGVEKVKQGSRTESVPLGELKKLAECRMLRFDQAIMQYTMENCMVLEDTNGNRKLCKDRHDQKIDNVAAMMDAYVAYKRQTEMFRDS